MLHQLLNLQSSSSVQWGGASKECSSSSFCRLPPPPPQLSRGQSPCSLVLHPYHLGWRGYPPHLVEVAETLRPQAGVGKLRPCLVMVSKKRAPQPFTPHRGEVRTEGHLPRLSRARLSPSHCFEDRDLKGSQAGAMSWVPSDRMSSWL